MNIGRHLLIERCHYNINSKISVQRKAYEERLAGITTVCKKIGTRCKLDKYNAYLQGEFTAARSAQ